MLSTFRIVFTVGSCVLCLVAADQKLAHICTVLALVMRFPYLLLLYTLYAEIASADQYICNILYFFIGTVDEVSNVASLPLALHCAQNKNAS